MNKSLLTFFYIVVGLSLLLAVSGCEVNDYQAAENAYNRGDYETALKELLPMADQGDARAQLILGLMYQKGQGVPQDYQEAIKWFHLAAAQGDALSQFGLGTIYYEGQGVPQDDQEAAKWYRLAAEQGDASAQSTLGMMYGTGKGVPQDYLLAHMWVNMAAAQGNEAGSKGVKILEEIMTPQQIAEAQRLVREWKAIVE